MLLASLRVAASKCCHALAMPAGGQEEAAGHEVVERIENLPRVDHRDRVAGPRGIASRHSDPLRFAHSRDQDRADTWYSSGLEQQTLGPGGSVSRHSVRGPSHRRFTFSTTDITDPVGRYQTGGFVRRSLPAALSGHQQ